MVLTLFWGYPGYMLDGKCERRLKSASPGKLFILPPSYCWSELPEGCSGSCPAVGVGRAPLSLGCESQPRAQAALSPWMGFSWRRALWACCPHACFPGTEGRLHAGPCLLFGEMALFKRGSQQANIPSKAGPKNKGYSSGESCKVRLFLTPRSTGCHLLWALKGQGPG